MNEAPVTDQQLLLTGKRVYKESVDDGGMFNSTLLVILDETPNAEKPFLGVVQNGWGGGVGRRFTTEGEAIRYVNDKFEELYG
jgi:hypothetical protein